MLAPFIPGSRDELEALRDRPVSDEVMAVAILGVISLARAEGQSLEDLLHQLKQEDAGSAELEQADCEDLCRLVTFAWDSLF